MRDSKEKIFELSKRDVRYQENQREIVNWQGVKIWLIVLVLESQKGQEISGKVILFLILSRVGRQLEKSFQ